MLPIALKSFHIKNYQGIIDTQIDDIPPDTQWIFLTGENGFGKTSILQNIAIRLFAEGQRTITLGKSYSDLETKYQYYLYGQGVTWQNQYNLHPKAFNIGRVFVAYGSSRLRTNDTVRKSNSFEPNLPFSSLVSVDTLLYDIVQESIDATDNTKDLFIKLEVLFKTLIPSLNKIQVEIVDDKPIVKYFEQDEQGELYKEAVSFTQLASGYKNIIGMIGDMVFRLSKYIQVDKLNTMF